MEDFTIKILSIALSAVTILSGYIWKSQNNRISELEKRVLAFNQIFPDIREIKTDLSWIKKKLFSND